MAAALRRLVAALGSGASHGRRAAAGACIAAGAAALYCGSVVGVGQRRRVEARLGHLALPTVSAADKAKAYDLDDGDAYMSTYENRFRLFSSVECEGQLYMTPLNFIESVTLNEPRSRRGWKSLTKKELEKVLSDTPPVWKGSSNLFRNLRERALGVASFRGAPAVVQVWDPQQNAVLSLRQSACRHSQLDLE